MTPVVRLTIQQWGNSLAVRIPSAVARSGHFVVGQPVEMTLDEFGLSVRQVGRPKLTLAQRLAQFDPEIHGGEVMATPTIGAELG